MCFSMNIGGFLVAAILLTLLPGPDILLVITQSIVRGTKTGIIFAAGLCTGIIFHTSVIAFGLSPLLTGNPTVFTTVKITGALYLIYIGIRAFLGRHKATLEIKEEHSGVERSPSGTSRFGFSRLTARRPQLKYYFRGVIMNVLNPKVILFFLALFPQFITVQEGESSAGQFLILGLLFMVQGFIIFSAVAFCAGKLSRYLSRNRKVAYYLCLVEAFMFTLLGILIVAA